MWKCLLTSLVGPRLDALLGLAAVLFTLLARAPLQAAALDRRYEASAQAVDVLKSGRQTPTRPKSPKPSKEEVKDSPPIRTSTPATTCPITNSRRRHQEGDKSQHRERHRVEAQHQCQPHRRRDLGHRQKTTSSSGA